MTNEERQQAIEWLKRRPVVMAGAKRVYDLAVEALEAYVPDMNVGETEPSREYECDNCGVTWQFNDGGPEENEAHFCPKCGFKMVPKGE